MPKRTLVTFPSKDLKESSQNIEFPLSEDIIGLIKDLKDTCVVEGGVGISAPQVGIQKRVMVAAHDGDLKVFINPTITSASEDDIIKDKEGCLSFPGFFPQIKRFNHVCVRYQNEEGTEVIDSFEGFTSRIVQHEIDHLDGVLMIDRMNRLDREKFLRKRARQHKKIKKMLSQMMRSA